MAAKFKSIEIHSEFKSAFVDFATEAHKRFPDLPDVRKAVITQVSNVITVTLPIKEAPGASRGDVSQDNFFEIAEDMFTMNGDETLADPIAWVA